MTAYAARRTWKHGFQFALIWASSQLATDLAALPSDRSVETCGFEPVKIEDLMLPVLPGNPLKAGREEEIVFDLLISSEGKLMAKGAYYAPSQSYNPPVARALDQSYYTPALECDVPVPGFIRHTVNDYFFPTKVSRTADLIEARPLWVLSRHLANRLDAFSRMGKESQVLIQFQIDKNGAVTRLRSNSRIGKALIEHFFEPIKPRLKFEPATRAGEPVKSGLTLRLATGQRIPSLETRDTAPQNEHSMPRYPKGESLEQPIEVIATIDFGIDGNVMTARVDENAREAFAIEVIKAIRSWRLQSGYGDDTITQTTMTYRFGFVPGEEDAFLLGQPERVTLIVPNPTKRVAPDYPLSMKAQGISGVVEAMFIVDSSGRVQDIRIRNSSHPHFSKSAIAALSKWKFDPGRRNDEPVAVRMMLPMRFNLNR